MVFDKHEYLELLDTLHVPVIAQNLTRLCEENSADVMFSHVGFQVMNCHTGEIHICGPRVNGLYLWPSNEVHALQPVTLSSIYQPLSTWHARLGHLSPNFLNYIISSNNLSLIKLSRFSCDSCKCMKSQRLSFYDLDSYIFHATWINLL